jgi:hypothetical protein
MTPNEFHEKFSDQIEINENCLEDMACPNCGSRGRFAIAVKTTAIFEDIGSEVEGDIEYEDDSKCSCRECEHDGTIEEFTIRDLDQLLTKLAEETEDKVV